jgi:hypothetical protein
MAAETNATQIRLVLVSMADGRTDGVPVGSYLADYDPEATTDMASPRGLQTPTRR